MARLPRKSIRKLVTLPPDLAERVEKFREASGAASESDALKALIEDGLKMRDKPEDLFRRCETATLGSQSVGDIVNLVTSDHPLVASTVVDSEALIVNLKHEADAAPERFRYSRSARKWKWEEYDAQYDQWNEKRRPPPPSAKPPSDLDDEIPF